MPITKLPKKGFYTDLKTGSSGWGPNRNYNSTRMEQIISASILGQVATSSALPATPTDGDTYYVQDTTFLATWVVYTGQPGQWFQDFTPTGLPIYDETLDAWFYFNGTALVGWPGAGGVSSVTGFYVDNTDVANPIVTAPKIHIDTVSPTVTDDDSQDFSIGSLWFNETNSALWICKDATAAAAVWLLINGSSITNYVVSGSSGGTISPALGTGPVTNFSAAITTSGKAVEIRVIPDGSTSAANASRFGNQNTGASDMEFNVIFKRDGTTFAVQAFRIAAENGAGDVASYVGPGAIYALDEDVVGLPGTYTYSIELDAITATTGGRILRSKMLVKEF